jgi:uncharacterized protein (TIGR03083 family)
VAHHEARAARRGVVVVRPGEVRRQPNTTGREHVLHGIGHLVDCTDADLICQVFRAREAGGMDRDTYLAHLSRDGRRIADLARGDLTATVPTCPGWTLKDLVEHTGMVHRWQTEAARHDHGTFPDASKFELAPVEGESWADWFQAGIDSAIATMSKVEPGQPRWTWAKPGGGDTTDWYFRRIAQETLVHRIDAELAAGDVTDVDAAFAADGIAEMFEVFVPLASGRAINGDGRTIHLHATDVESEWLLRLQQDRVDAEPSHGKGDAALRGMARDLLLMSWGREPLGDVEHFGRDDVIATFTAATKL